MRTLWLILVATALVCLCDLSAADNYNGFGGRSVNNRFYASTPLYSRPGRMSYSTTRGRSLLDDPFFSDSFQDSSINTRFSTTPFGMDTFRSDGFGDSSLFKDFSFPDVNFQMFKSESPRDKSYRSSDGSSGLLGEKYSISKGFEWNRDEDSSGRKPVTKYKPFFSSERVLIEKNPGENKPKVTYWKNGNKAARPEKPTDPPHRMYPNILSDNHSLLPLIAKFSTKEFDDDADFFIRPLRRLDTASVSKIDKGFRKIENSRSSRQSRTKDSKPEKKSLRDWDFNTDFFSNPFKQFDSAKSGNGRSSSRLSSLKDYKPNERSSSKGYRSLSKPKSSRGSLRMTGFDDPKFGSANLGLGLSSSLGFGDDFFNNFFGQSRQAKKSARARQTDFIPMMPSPSKHPRFALSPSSSNIGARLFSSRDSTPTFRVSSATATINDPFAVSNKGNGYRPRDSFYRRN